MPKQAATDAAKIDAATCRLAPSEPTMRSVPSTSETLNAAWWSTPLMRGFARTGWADDDMALPANIDVSATRCTACTGLLRDPGLEREHACIRGHDPRLRETARTHSLHECVVRGRRDSVGVRVISRPAGSEH